jgi:hypothetical protein
VTAILQRTAKKNVDESVHLVGSCRAGTDKRLTKKLKITRAGVDTRHKRYR